MEYDYKEVYYDQYCSRCVHLELEEDDEPCRDCLDEPVNVYSHKPIYWEENK